MLTMQALMNKKITVFGGDQARPNIHIRDMIRIYQHFIAKGKSIEGVFNAGFENLKIIEIANKIKETADAEVVVTESNDPRSYRLNSDKLLATGFKPEYGVQDGINEVKNAYINGALKDDEKYYTIKTMMKLGLKG